MTGINIFASCGSLSVDLKQSFQDNRGEKLHLEKGAPPAAFILKTSAQGPSTYGPGLGLNARGPCSGGGIGDLEESPGSLSDFRHVSLDLSFLNCQMGMITPVLPVLHDEKA